MELYERNNYKFMLKKAETNLGDKEILLTFDDGPNANQDITLLVLGILAKHDVKACFCVIGKFAEENPGLVKAIYEAGHCLVNHSYAHHFPVFKTYAALLEDALRTDQAIGNALNFADYRSEFYRPPFGLITKNIKKVVLANNYSLLKVTAFTPLLVDSEINGKNAHKIYRYLIKKIENDRGGIIVFHDGSSRLLNKPVVKNSHLDRSWVPVCIDELLAYFKANHYQFRNLTNSSN